MTLLAIPPRGPASRIWGAATLLGLAGLLGWFYGPVLADPNGHVFCTSGDGAKNYFTFAYHVANDNSWMSCEGVSYPFGELVFFTDGHPALSWILQALPFTAPYAIGILNVMLLLGLVAYGMLVFALLRRFGLAGWAAAAGALGLTLLQPQIFRLEGHLALAHAWLLPLAWYLHLRGRDPSRPWRWSIAMALVLAFAYFTHPYLGLMLSIFLGASWFLLGIRSSSERRAAVKHGMLQAVAPLALFVLVLKAVDHHTDRPVAPNTGDDNLASVSGLVMPHYPTDSPLKPLTDLWSDHEPSWESWCYLGVATIALLIAAALVQLMQWSRRNGPLRDRRHDDIGLYLGAAAIVLFFAMGMHKPLEVWLPLLKQFRGAARFAWVFYMAAGVFGLVRLYGWLRLDIATRKHWRMAVFLLAPLLTSVEGWPYWRASGWAVSQAPNPFNAELLTGDQRALIEVVRKEKPVAILPLPFEHWGSEVYQRGGKTAVFQSVYPMSYHTGIPVFAGIASRTSVTETIEQFAVLAPLDFPKNIEEHLPADGRIMIATARDPLEPDEQALLARATLVFENPLAQLYMMNVSELVRCTGLTTLKAYREGWYRIDDHHGLQVEWPTAAAELDTGRMVFHWPVDEERIARVSESVYLFNSPPGELDTNYDYELSFVFREVDPGSINIPIIWAHSPAEGGDATWEWLKNVRSMPVIAGDRVFAAMRFRPKGQNRRNALALSGRDWIDLRYRIEHIVLRRTDVHIWREEEAPGGILVLRDNVPLNPEVLGPIVK